MTHYKQIRLEKAIRAYKWICRDESIVSHSSQYANLDNVSDSDLDKIVECILPCPHHIETERDIRMLLGYLVVTCHLGIQFHPNKWLEYVESFSPVKYKRISSMYESCLDLYVRNQAANIYELITQLIYELELPS